MQGEITITIYAANEVKNITVFDLFRMELQHLSKHPSAGYYAYKVINNSYNFLWTDNQNNENIYSKKKYMLHLKNDGYTIPHEYMWDIDF